MKKWPMKKRVFSLTILTVTPLLLLVVAFTWESTGVHPLNLLIPHQQWWGGKSNVSNTPAFSGLVDLAVGGTDIHMVWKEDVGGNANIHFKNKAKEDANWSDVVDLTKTTTGKCLNPAMAVVDNGTNDHIHVVWEDYYEGNHRDILYRKSLNGGSAWDDPLGSPPDSITSDAYDAIAPDIAVTSTIPHVVWHGKPDGSRKIYYSQDPDGSGTSWTTPYAVSTSANENVYPAIAIDGSNRIHVTWYDFNGVIQYRRLEGSDWSPSVKDLTIGDNSTHPDIAAKGDDVYVVWNTALGGSQYQVWCRRWDGQENSWQTSRLIATVTTAFISDYPTPRVSVDISDTVHVAWHALGTTNEQEIWHSKSTDNGANWSPPVNVSENPDEDSQLASIGTDSERDAHVAWQEEVSGQWDIFYRRTDIASAHTKYMPILMKNY